MNRKRLTITIDTENPQTPLYQKKFYDNRFWSNGNGIQKIVEILNEFGIAATFFTNIYEYKIWGKEKIANVLRYLSDNGQDIELHTHPIWIDNKRREFMFQYSFNEQKSIIELGKKFIEDLIGKPIVAHRAGGYGFNEDTLKACAEIGIKIDSSNFFGHPNCKTVVTKNKTKKEFGILEVPITSFYENEKLLKLDPDWIDEIKFMSAVNKLLQDTEIQNLTMMLHSYSLLSFENDFRDFKVDDNKIKRLRFILKELKEKNELDISPITGILPIVKNSNYIINKEFVFHSQKKQIVFVKRHPQIRIFKEAYALKKKYPDYELILIANKIDHSLFQTIFDRIYHFKDHRELSWLIKQFSPLVFHVHAEPNAEPAVVIENSKYPVIYDVYDFSGIRYGLENLNETERTYEKYSLENADAIVFKFHSSILNYYREKGYKIDVPVLTYLDYCLPEYFVNSEPLHSFNLTYTGVLNPSNMPREKYGNNQYIDFVKAIVTQEIGFHIFINKWQIEEESAYEDYLELSRKNPFLTFNFALPQIELQRKISKFHFGCSLHDFSVTNHHPLFGETSIGNKLSTYLEAGLPIIVSSNLKYNLQVVEELGIGLGVKLNELEGLRKNLESLDYKKLKNKVCSVRENEFSALNNVHSLMNFYKKISN